MLALLLFCSHLCIRLYDFYRDIDIVVKAGETKRFLMTDEDGKDLLFCRTWKVSNKNVIFLQTDFTDDYTKEYVELTANNLISL